MYLTSLTTKAEVPPVVGSGRQLFVFLCLSHFFRGMDLLDVLHLGRGYSWSASMASTTVIIFYFCQLFSLFPSSSFLYIFVQHLLHCPLCSSFLVFLLYSFLLDILLCFPTIYTYACQETNCGSYVCGTFILSMMPTAIKCTIPIFCVQEHQGESFSNYLWWETWLSWRQLYSYMWFNTFKVYLERSIAIIACLLLHVELYIWCFCVSGIVVVMFCYYNISHCSAELTQYGSHP